MINQLIHRQVEAIDARKHAQTRLVTGQSDWTFASRLNSIFVTATEFGDACRELPLVFIEAGKDEAGKRLIAPIAVLGLVAEDNLFVEGSSWRGRYAPAVLRAYPFCTARLENGRFAVCLDMSFSGISQTEGQPLFDEQGKPSELLERAQKQLEALETEVQRTRLLCDKLLELELLREMRFDATLPDGRKHTVDGFLTIDQERVTKLTEAQVVELHRTGVLGLIHAHWISLGNMRTLLEQHMARHPAPAAAAAEAAATPAEAAVPASA